jgi:hypothetical protein
MVPKREDSSKWEPVSIPRPEVSVKRGRLSKRNAAKHRKAAMAPERARVRAEMAMTFPKVSA